VSLATSTAPPGLVRIPGLQPDALYSLEAVHLTDSALNRINGEAPVWWREGAVMSGESLNSFGVQAPIIYPEQQLLFRARRVSDE
jgi:alpha-galactosidase